MTTTRKARTARFEIHKDKKGEYRWRLFAKNGRIVADSGEGYVTKAACAKAKNRLWAVVFDTEGDMS